MIGIIEEVVEKGKKLAAEAGQGGSSMVKLRSSIVVALSLIPAMALAQSPQSLPTVEKAIESAYMLFCMPLVAKDATNTAEVAKWSKYEPTALPDLAMLKVRTAPAWLVPSAQGRVVVARGSADPRLPTSCEIVVSGTPGAPLRKKLSELTLCEKCPFVRNTALPQEKNGAFFDKFDWRMPDKNALLSVIAVTPAEGARGVTFFAHVHMVR